MAPTLPAVRCYTIGHSNQTWNAFEAMLRAFGVTTLIDVRSRPRSRFHRFDGKHLEWWLPTRGLRYLWLGEGLGGKPADTELYDARGEPDYARIRQGEPYRRDLLRLLEELRDRAGGVCLMCAEEDPERCHRHLLIEPDLARRGVEVLHIRKGAGGGPVLARYVEGRVVPELPAPPVGPATR